MHVKLSGRENETGLVLYDIFYWPLGLDKGNTKQEQGRCRCIKYNLEMASQNPFAVTTRPWCGAFMGPVEVGSSYRVKGYRKPVLELYFFVKTQGVLFHDSRGLPLVLL